MVYSYTPVLKYWMKSVMEILYDFWLTLRIAPNLDTEPSQFKIVQFRVGQFSDEQSKT